MLFKILRLKRLCGIFFPPFEDVSSAEMGNRTIEKNVSSRHKASSWTRGVVERVDYSVYACFHLIYKHFFMLLNLCCFLTRPVKIIFHRTTEKLGLEENYGDCLVQSSCTREVSWTRLSKTVSSWVLNISKDGDATKISMSNAFQFMVIDSLSGHH